MSITGTVNPIRKVLHTYIGFPENLKNLHHWVEQTSVFLFHKKKLQINSYLILLKPKNTKELPKTKAENFSTHKQQKMIDSSLPPHTKILNCNKYNDREK